MVQQNVYTKIGIVKIQTREDMESLLKRKVFKCKYLFTFKKYEKKKQTTITIKSMNKEIQKFYPENKDTLLYSHTDLTGGPQKSDL